MNPTLRTLDRTPLLFAMWIFLSANWLCCDILTLMDPAMIRMLAQGGPASLRIDQHFLLISALVLEIPILMIVLSRLLPLRPRRCSSLLGSLAVIAVQAGSFWMGDPPTLHYIFFSAVQTLGALVVLVAAATWRTETDTTPPAQAPRRSGEAVAFPKFLAWIAMALVCLTSQARAADTLATTTPAPKDSLCRISPHLFLSTPFSLKETRSVAAIGLGWDGTKWATRLDLGFMEDGMDPRGPISLDLTGGVFWKHNFGLPVTIYEGITVTDQTGLYHSFDGHAVSMVFLAGCEFRPDHSQYAFHVEAGTGGAFTSRAGSYKGGTVVSAGLRHYIGR